LANENLERKSFFRTIRGKANTEPKEMSFFDHIDELRKHIFRSAAVWMIASILIFVYIDWVYDYVILAPANANFISYSALCDFGHWLFHNDSFCMPPVKIDFQINTVNGTFTSAINIAMVGGLMAAFPYIFFEIWQFVKPALTPKERRYGRGSIFYVSLCFFTGAAFGYYILAPFTFNFLASFSLGKLNMIIYRPSLNDYIETLTNLVLGCGIAFELPVLSYVLAKLGIITGTFLKKQFKYAIVVILFVAAIITPSPDWTSQFLVALPLLLLYLISIFLAGRVERKRKKEEDKEWS
jgi:sec-independent protein translocase protein TatC